jgi:hypothetical protein
MISQYSCVLWDPKKKSDKDERTDRYLGHDPKHGLVALINAYNPKAKIKVMEDSDFLDALKSGLAEEREISIPRVPPSPAVEAYQKNACETLEPFRQAKPNYLFSRNERARLVRVCMEASGQSEPTVRDLLRRTLQAGFNQDAIFCKYTECGKSERPRLRPQKKRGNKKRYPGHGIPTTNDPLETKDYKFFVKVIKKYLMGPVNRGVARRFVFNHHIKRPYREKLKAGGPDARPLPTFRQFDYFIKNEWADKIEASRQTSIARGTGGRAKNREGSLLNPTGPGQVYQIDSTVADIDLIADTDGKKKQSIGSPVLYLVVDVYSHMIVGFHVTLGSPCYEEAVIALVSVLEDKVKLCREFGIKIKAKAWPKSPLPDNLVGDRQEFISKNSNFLGKRLRIKVSNTPKYRGDFKGLVEQCLLRRMQTTWTFPGSKDKKASKDEKSGKPDATLTLKQFIRLIILDIIKANNRTLESIALPPEAAKNPKLRKKPSWVFAWGTEKLEGGGKHCSLQDARIALLPRAHTASIRPEGLFVSYKDTNAIWFRDLENKLVPKYTKKGKKLPEPVVQVDPRTMNHVYIEHPETHEILVCPISDRSKEYSGMTWVEGAAFKARKQILQLDDEEDDEELENYLNNQTDETLTESVEAVKEMPKSSIAAMTDGEKEARNAEYQKELAARQKRIGPTAQTTTSYEKDEDDDSSYYG